MKVLGGPSGFGGGGHTRLGVLGGGPRSWGGSHRDEGPGGVPVVLGGGGESHRVGGPGGVPWVWGGSQPPPTGPMTHTMRSRSSRE